MFICSDFEISSLVMFTMKKVEAGDCSGLCSPFEEEPCGHVIVAVSVILEYIFVRALIKVDFHLWQRWETNIPIYVNLMRNAGRRAVATFVLVIPIIIWIMVGALTLILKHLTKASWPCLEQSASNMCMPVKCDHAWNIYYYFYKLKLMMHVLLWIKRVFHPTHSWLLQTPGTWVNKGKGYDIFFG